MGLVIYFIDLVFTLLSYAIIARAILSWLPIDRYNPLIYWLDRITEPLLAPLRRYVPLIGMMDITPIVALLILQVLQALTDNILLGMFYR